MALSATRSTEDVERSLRHRLGDDLFGVDELSSHLVARVAPQRRPDALRALKDDLDFRFYDFCAGVDYPDENRIDVLDNVISLTYVQRLTVKYGVDRTKPRIPTAIEVYAGADWHERETWELLGVHFVGHPRLARLLLPDWQDGHPLRKDFELPARVEKPWPGDWFSG